MLPGAGMTRRRWLESSAAALAVLPAACGPAEEESFEPIFNARDLTGWEGDTLLWVVEDGLLIGRSPGISYNDFLAATAPYGDFVLQLRFRLVDGKGNSGIQFRSQRVPGSTEMIGYQADIGEGWWGSLYDESRRRKPLTEVDASLLQRIIEPAGWNEYEIRAEGPHIRLKLNGETTVDYTEPDASIEQQGLIAVQIHSGPAMEIQFQDLRLRAL
jgi:hypothetical protein